MRLAKDKLLLKSLALKRNVTLGRVAAALEYASYGINRLDDKIEIRSPKFRYAFSVGLLYFVLEKIDLTLEENNLRVKYEFNWKVMLVIICSTLGFFTYRLTELSHGQLSYAQTFVVLLFLHFLMLTFLFVAYIGLTTRDLKKSLKNELAL